MGFKNIDLPFGSKKKDDLILNVFSINESKTRCNERLVGTLMFLPAILKSKSIALIFLLFN